MASGDDLGCVCGVKLKTFIVPVRRLFFAYGLLKKWKQMKKVGMIQPFSFVSCKNLSHRCSESS